MKTLQLKAQLRPGKRYSDGSVGITFVTAEEIDTELFAQIDSWRQQNGWLLFKANEFADSDIPKENAEIEGGKTPSQRLRGVLYVLHQQQGGKSEDFPDFYNREMNKVIELIKAKLE